MKLTSFKLFHWTHQGEKIKIGLNFWYGKRSKPRIIIRIPLPRGGIGQIYIRYRGWRNFKYKALVLIVEYYKFPTHKEYRIL